MESERSGSEEGQEGERSELDGGKGERRVPLAGAPASPALVRPVELAPCRSEEGRERGGFGRKWGRSRRHHREQQEKGEELGFSVAPVTLFYTMRA